MRYCIFRDERGHWKADSSKLPPIICTAFEDDIQGSSHFCHQVLNAIHETESNPEREFSFGGNAHSIDVSATGVRFTNEYDESIKPLTLPLQEAKTLFHEWVKALESTDK
jgi:hypothetical protein